MKKLNEYFQFSKSERNGIIVLLIILFIVIIAPSLYKQFTSPSNTNYSDFNNEIIKFIKGQELLEEKKKQQYANKQYFSKKKHSSTESFDYNDIDGSSAKRKIQPFFFNPNNLPREKWLKMGFSEKQVNVIENYVSKGGKFYDKKDVKKIYSISDDEYKIIEPYIVIPEEKQDYTDTTYDKSFNDKKSYKDLIIDINSADTLSFRKLKGIGKVYSNRIVKYRELLGGFARKEQIMDVWGIEKELYDQIKSKLKVGEKQLKKININTCTIDELKQHPYIDYYVARSIVKYRQSHGKYKKTSDIMKSALVHETLYNKLKPYLSINKSLKNEE